jgi:hypothetical protein
MNDFEDGDLELRINYELALKIISSLLLLTTLALILAGNVSAAPYQLNLSTGELIDLNVSNNETANITIYVLNYTTTTINNITNSNVTINQTQVNKTDIEIINRTYINETYNGIYNFSSYYTKAEVDSMFQNSVYKVPLGDFNNLVARVNVVNDSVWNVTEEGIDKTTKTKANVALWVSLVAVLLAALIFFLLKRDEVI